MVHLGSPTTLIPLSTAPFRRDPDFVDREILAEIDKKCSKPASRAALVGLGGVGQAIGPLGSGSRRTIIKVEPMDEGRALLLFEKKIRGGFDKQDAIGLLRALDYMPPAIDQAAVYISQSDLRTTVSKYLDSIRNSDRHRANPLNIDAGDPRGDSQALNSIITTRQISFEYIRNERPLAARLLSLMSF
ncbi:hypothetical protein MMC29_002373 [Sticta canariensis]|nr:hypothetical protein [Sticta canariensis]